MGLQDYRITKQKCAQIYIELNDCDLKIKEYV